MSTRASAGGRGEGQVAEQKHRVPRRCRGLTKPTPESVYAFMEAEGELGRCTVLRYRSLSLSDPTCVADGMGFSEEMFVARMGCESNGAPHEGYKYSWDGKFLDNLRPTWPYAHAWILAVGVHAGRARASIGPPATGCLLGLPH